MTVWHQHKLPATYAFSTGLGTAGLLQVIRITDQPGIVEIRYKLIERERDAVVRPSR